MKKVLFPLLVVLGLFLSCVEREDFPSPLEGLHIENQTFSSAGIQKVIPVDNVLTNVYKPYVKVTFSANGKTYTKKVEY